MDYLKDILESTIQFYRTYVDAEPDIKFSGKHVIDLLSHILEIYERNK